MKSLQLLRKELLKRRDLLRRGVQAEETSLVARHEQGLTGDIADWALNFSEDELDYHLAEVGAREFGQVERAIQRFDEGTYGTCEMCQCLIPIARLKALPFAECCIHCQQSAEEEQNSDRFNDWRTYDAVSQETVGWNSYAGL